jgi:hypothetical protein
MSSVANMPLIDRIERVVDTLVSNNEMFTLLDISQAVKQDGGAWASHSQMKPTIETVLSNRFSTQTVYAYYTESVITVQTAIGPTTARLFHHVSDNPSQYTHRSQKALGPKVNPPPTPTLSQGCPCSQKASGPKVNPPPTPTLSPGHPSVTGRSVKNSRTQQAQGYIEVPKAIWEKAGLRTLSDVVLDIHPNSITVYRLHENSKYVAKVKEMARNNYPQAIVPSAGRFRITPQHLALASLTGKDLSFSAYTDKFVVYPTSSKK